MKRKKLGTVCIIMLSLVLSACGKGQKTDVTANNEHGTEVTAKPEDKPSPMEPLVFNTDASIEETVIYEEDDIKITATELEYSDYDATLNLLIENNSQRDLTFVSGSLGYSCNAINGYMVDDGYLNAEVASGKKSNESVSFSTEELMIYGINTIADIQFGIEIEEDFNEIYTGICQLKTTAADSYDYSEDTYLSALRSGLLESTYDCSVDFYSEDELYNQKGIRIVSEALMTNKDGEQAFLVEMINTTDKLFYGVTSDIVVNGLGISSFICSNDSINAGCRRIIDLSIEDIFDKTYWEKFGISEIGELSFDFTINDEKQNEYLKPQTISIRTSDKTASFNNEGEELFNESGFRIISKGLISDSSDLLDDIHLLLVVENSSDQVVTIDEVRDSLSVNGFMTDCITSGQKINSGCSAVLDIAIQESSLEDNKISELEEIKEIEMSFEIKNDDYETIKEPKIKMLLE